MSYYQDVYLKRLNRYGLDYQSRVAAQRERNFENYLLKTIYRVDFEWDGKMQAGSLEYSKQDQTQTVAYLLTRRTLSLPAGSILDIIYQDGRRVKWMIWWLEHNASSGYNRYIVLRMTHTLSWAVGDETISLDAYLFGPGKVKMTDEVKSGSGAARYLENNNLYMFITGYNTYCARSQYFTTTFQELENGYEIKEVDSESTPGVLYVTIDPVPLRNKTSYTDEGSVDNYWLNGGV